MPLAVKNGQLVGKNGNLCSGCCGPDPNATGCCYTVTYDNNGKPVYIITKNTLQECANLQNQADPQFDVIWKADRPEDAGKPCPDDPRPDDSDCGYCIQYRFAPSTGTTTHVLNCVTRKHCQDRADGGENVQFFAWECMDQGGADFVQDGQMCDSLPCCKPINNGGAWCEAPYQQIDMICKYTKADAEAEAARLEANSTVWCGIAATGSKEPIQDGTSCSGDDKTGLPRCPDYQTDGCTGTHPGLNDPVYGDECDCGPGWWLEVWDLVPGAGWTCTDYLAEPVPPPSPFGHWHPGQSCADINNCVGGNTNRRNPLP